VCITFNGKYADCEFGRDGLKGLTFYVLVRNPLFLERDPYSLHEGTEPLLGQSISKDVPLVQSTFLQRPRYVQSL